MGLNESKGNMYDWVTHTWNTVKGECPHGCTYCYMKRWGKQKHVRFDKKELKTDLGSGNFIFVGSSCDMWAKEIPIDWITKTLEHCKKYDNRYLFQSKNPNRMAWHLVDNLNAVICTTIETNRWYPEIMMDSPKVEWRAEALYGASMFDRYVTIEPIMDFDLDELVKLIRMCNPIQVNIGADSGNNGLPEPSASQVLDLIVALGEFTTVAKKRNLKRLGV